MVTDHVWYKFTVKDKNGDLKLRIQDTPNDRCEDVLSLFVNYFAAEETFHKIAGVSKSKDAQDECRDLVTYMMKDSKVLICCVDDGSDSSSIGDVIAAGIMTLSKKDDPEEEFDFAAKTKEMARVFEIMGPIFESYDALKELEIESIYDDRGVVVHPDYRGLGIAQQMFHVRRLICKEEGVPMTGAWMTGYGSQKAAERDGWETVFTMSYEELGKRFDVEFEGVPSTCKFMVGRPLQA